MKQQMRSVLLILAFNMISWLAIGQPGDPGGGNPTTVPISGIELLIAIGSLFGASRFLKSGNKSKES